MHKLLNIVRPLLLALLVVCTGPLHAEDAAERWEIVTDIYIGVQTEKLPAGERAAYGEHLPRWQGLRVKSVIPGSPAANDGLRAGDIVLKVNGASIASMEDLLLSVRNTRPGELIHINVFRDGAKQTIPVRVGALPEPVVVAHATLTMPTPPNMEAMAGNQRRIAALLGKATPDLQAIHAEFAAINRLFPHLGRPGQVRLYYETEDGYLTVTDYPGALVVTLRHNCGTAIYRLVKQGDTLPAHVVELFAELQTE